MQRSNKVIVLFISNGISSNTNMIRDRSRKRLIKCSMKVNDKVFYQILGSMYDFFHMLKPTSARLVLSVIIVYLFLNRLNFLLKKKFIRFA